MALRWLLAAVGIGLLLVAGWLVNQPTCCSGPAAHLFGWVPPPLIVPIALVLGFGLTASALFALVSARRLRRVTAVALLAVLALGVMSALGQAILYTGPPPASARHCPPHG
jgi:hypothetical protein